MCLGFKGLILKTDWEHPYKTQQHSKLDEPKKTVQEKGYEITAECSH